MALRRVREDWVTNKDMDILMVTKSHFHFVVFFGVVLVMTSIAVAIWLMPNGGVTSIQTVAFNQKKFEFSHSVDRSGLEVLKKIRLQRTPDKRTQKDKAGDRKSNPKPQLLVTTSR